MTSQGVLRLVPSSADEPPLDARDDDALMRLTAAGLDAAFEVLVRRHQGALRAFCARACGSLAGDDQQAPFRKRWKASTSSSLLRRDGTGESRWHRWEVAYTCS